MPPSPSPAVLFDLDGTLVDSLRDIAESMNAVLTAHGHPPHPRAAYRQFVGDGMTTLVQRVLPPDAATPHSIRNLERDLRKTYAERWRDHADPYPGIPAMLQRLADARVDLGVMSNKPEAFTRAMVDHVFPDLPWAHIRGAREGVPVKPAPDGGLDLLRTWNRNPQEVRYVGDTRTDILFARHTGMPSIGVTWGFRDREELAAHGAHHIVDTPEELAALILMG